MCSSEAAWSLLPLFPVLFIRVLLRSISMAASDVEYRCFVGGLAWSTDDVSLERAFSAYGEIVDSKVQISS